MGTRERGKEHGPEVRESRGRREGRLANVQHEHRRNGELEAAPPPRFCNTSPATPPPPLCQRVGVQRDEEEESLRRDVRNRMAIPSEEREHREGGDDAAVERERGHGVTCEEERSGEEREEDALLMHLVREEEEGHGGVEERVDEAARCWGPPQQLDAGGQHAEQRRAERKHRERAAREATAQLQRDIEGAPHVRDLVLEEPALEGEEPSDELGDAPHTRLARRRVDAERSDAERRGDKHGSSYLNEVRELHRGAGAVRAAREEVEEEGGRVVERHVLEEQREDEEHARRDLPPLCARPQQLHRRPKCQRQCDAIVLEVAMVDEDEAGLEENERDGFKGTGPVVARGAAAGSSSSRAVERNEAPHRGEEEDDVEGEDGEAHKEFARDALVAARGPQRDHRGEAHLWVPRDVAQPLGEVR